MKKFLSVVLAVVMLSALCATLAVSADANAFMGTQFNPEGTPDPAKGVIYTTSNTTNGWWGQASFKPVDGGKGWEVVATANPEGTNGVEALAIPEGGFVWSIYPWSNIDSVRACFDFMVALEPGAQYAIDGLDLANKTCAEDATIAPYVPSADEEEPAEPTAEWKDLWLTHYNDNTAEGSGVAFTDAYTGANWWLHVAFAPVEGSKAAYEIVAISDGTDVGDGVAQAIPEGGFVYCLNYGNDYPALGYADSIDYATDGARAMIEDVMTNWTIGDKFVFEGLNLTNKTVPTSTPDVEWYKDGEYVCTGKYKVYEPAIDDVVTDDESTDSEESTTPEAGDASSMIVFAIIALVAIAGSAVVVKTRR